MSAAPNALGNGWAFGGQKAMTLEQKLARLAAENARRVNCQHCDLRILPDTMARHVRICHR